MIIIGAGMAGLLAARMIVQKTEIWEAQSSLPNNHSAVLRFRSSIVGDTTGIPFKKVRMMKCIGNDRIWGNPVQRMLNYSIKTNGGYYMRSLAGDEDVQERFIAPEDLIQQMAQGADIKFNRSFAQPALADMARTPPIISTIPMPTLMDILGYDGPRPLFNSVAGETLTAEIDAVPSDVYCSVYCTDVDLPFYRVSITGKKLIVEYAWPPNRVKPADDFKRYALPRALQIIGVDIDHITEAKMSEARYAKILECDRDLAKRFMLWATEKFNVYSLGRFATWRPGLLMDDCVNDIRKIQQMIKSGHNYEARRK